MELAPTAGHVAGEDSPHKDELPPIEGARPLLQLENFTYTPPGRSEPVLQEFSITIPPDQSVLLCGPSGSGKSTIIRALAGLINADGEDPDAINPTAHTGMLIQNPVHTFVSPAAGIDIAFFPENQELSPEQITDRVFSARSAAHFSSPLDADPFELSGGQQQRLALAGVLAGSPGALLLDEPLAMLDPATAVQVRNQIVDASSAAGAEKSLVVADHLIDLWLPFVERVVQIGHAGQIVADTSPTEFAALKSEDPGPPTKGAAAHIGSEVLRIEPVRELEGRLLFEDGVGLKVHRGELVAISGESGVGKSTFLRHILSRCYNKSTKAYEAAWLPQNPEKLFVALRVEDEIRAGAASAAAADRAASLLGVAALSDSNPYAISGGEQRRVAFASALATERDILIVDEPTVGLDDASFGNVMDLISEALASGRAVIAATHDSRLIERADTHVHLVGASDRGDLRGALTETSSAGGSNVRTVPPVRLKPRKVPADALNPLTILVVAAAAFAGNAAIHNLWAGLAGSTLALVCVPFAFRTWKRFAMRMVPMLLATASVAWSAAILSGRPLAEISTWQAGAVEGLRIFAMIAPGAILMEAVEPARLGQALAQKLKIPARFAAVMISGLSRLGHMFGEWNALILSRKVRGIHRKNALKLYASATFALLVGTLRDAEVQALAMDARGFAYATKRTWVHRSKFGGPDLIGLIFALIVLAAPIVAVQVF